MRMVSLNVWGGVMREPLLEFFRKNSDVDVFCLSEVWEADQIPDRLRNSTKRNIEPRILSKIKGSLPQHDCYFSPAQDKAFGLAMLIKKGIEVAEKGDMFVHRWEDAMENEDPRTLGKNLQYAKIITQKRHVTISHFHGLWTGGPKEDTDARMEQSRKVKNFLDSVDGPKILCGDFNLLPSTKSISIMEGGMRNLIEEFGVESTRSGMYDRQDKFADYMLVSPEITVKDFRVLPDVVSDHLALYLDFE